jgi:GNAT superfamily N-acetyltransferase
MYADARRFMAQNGNPDQWGQAFPPEDLVRGDLARGCSYVCEEEGALLAVFYFALEEDPVYARILGGQWLNEASYGVVHRFAVCARGRGVASFCLAWSMAQCGNVRISTHFDNHPMRAALDKNGFTYCGLVFEGGGGRLAYQKCDFEAAGSQLCRV